MAFINPFRRALLLSDGAMCAALLASSSGMILGPLGSGFSLEIAETGHTGVVRAKLKTIHTLGRADRN